MTRQLLILFFPLFSIFLFSCSKEKNKPGTGFSETPVAKAQFDNSNYGIYKGIFTGSTGNLIINIKNDGSLFASLYIDDVGYDNDLVYTYTTTATVNQNEATAIEFKGGTGSSFTFSVGANGANPAITDISIAGHPNAKILVAKETSATLVKCFEGAYTGAADNGIFNTVIFGNQVRGLIKSSSSSVTDIATGTLNNNELTASGALTPVPVFTGTLSGNNLSGNWIKSGSSESGTWTAKRTY